MNFLAHLALAGPSDVSRIGNLLGDFEKGTPDTLRARLPEDIVAGIIMHRRIDAFTDAHRHFREARKLLSPSRRRFAGIVVDIFFDHFLTLHWSRYHPDSVSTFIQNIYATLDNNVHLLGTEFAPLLPRIKSENWLAAYGNEAGLELTLNRVASRSSRLAPLSESILDFHQNREAFEQAFLAFYPLVRQKAGVLLGLKSLQTPSFP